MAQIQPIINENIDSLIFGNYSTFFSNNPNLKTKYNLVINYEAFNKNPYGEFLKFLKMVGDMHNIHFIQDQEYTRYANTEECKNFMQHNIPFPMVVIYFKERVELSSVTNLLTWTSFKDVLSMVIPSSIKGKDFNEIIKLINARGYVGNKNFYHGTNSKEHPFKYKLPNKDAIKSKQEYQKMSNEFNNFKIQLTNMKKDYTTLSQKFNTLEANYNTKTTQLNNLKKDYTTLLQKFNTLEANYNTKITQFENRIKTLETHNNKIPLGSLPTGSTIPGTTFVQHNPMMYGTY